MPVENYCRRFGSWSLCSCDVIMALINSHLCVFIFTEVPPAKPEVSPIPSFKVAVHSVMNQDIYSRTTESVLAPCKYGAFVLHREAETVSVRAQILNLFLYNYGTFHLITKRSCPVVMAIGVNFASCLTHYRLNSNFHGFSSACVARYHSPSIAVWHLPAKRRKDVVNQCLESGTVLHTPRFVLSNLVVVFFVSLLLIFVFF